jgi:hypothetical protein
LAAHLLAFSLHSFLEGKIPLKKNQLKAQNSTST